MIWLPTATSLIYICTTKTSKEPKLFPEEHLMTNGIARHYELV